MTPPQKSGHSAFTNPKLNNYDKVQHTFKEASNKKVIGNTPSKVNFMILTTI